MLNITIFLSDTVENCILQPDQGKGYKYHTYETEPKRNMEGT
jgi:hypothetical protein